jgi:hypothetical protein
MKSWINNTPEYTPYPIEEFRGNPLVEAIKFPPLNNDDAIKRLMRRPSFDSSERELPAMMRMLLPARLKNFMFPTTQHVKILKLIYCQLLDGYRFRNPCTPDTQRLMHSGKGQKLNFEPVIDSPSSRPATISFLTGLSGMGKSTLIRAVMGTMGRPVIMHSNYQGKPFTESQILYLMRNVPDQCTPKMLCKSYGTYTDSLLATQIYTKPFSTDLSRSGYVDEMKKIITNHHIGALVLDEFQNLSLAGTKGLEELISLLINFRDQLGVPIILVGTYRAADLVHGGLSITRRLVEGGFHELQRPLTPYDEDWSSMCEIAWEFQWVKNPSEFSDKILNALYECSQGITAIMLTLFMAAQVEAIDSGVETVDVKLLKSVYRDQMKPLHQIINALRSGDVALLNNFDDLYIKAFSDLNKDNKLSRLALVQKKLEEEQERQVGIVNGTVDEVPASATKGKARSKWSASELLKEIGSPPENLFEVLS